MKGKELKLGFLKTGKAFRFFPFPRKHKGKKRENLLDFQICEEIISGVFRPFRRVFTNPDYSDS
jgi:hypothetical protein